VDYRHHLSAGSAQQAYWSNLGCSRKQQQSRLQPESSSREAAAWNGSAAAAGTCSGTCW
jgi:hypothetical protein